MDTSVLSELLEEVTKRGGGLVLNTGDKPTAVVLSVEKYYQLLQGVPVMEQELTIATPTPTREKGTILVTGGAGYIGSHTVRTLLEAGFPVVVVDNLSTGKREFVPETVPFYEGDIGDGNFLRDVFSQHAIVCVMHFAASLEVEESVHEPTKYLENNTVGTITLLRVMEEVGVKQIIFSSTAAIYGEQEVIPIPETAESRPNNPYGHSKLLAEQALKYFSDHVGFSVTILRYFNVCGTNPDWRITDTHKNSHLIPVILEVAQGVRPIIIINGSDYATDDGTCVRDYVHVRDIARAHVAALEHKPSQAFRVYNIGTGRGVSVKEMINSAAEVTARMIPMEMGVRRPGDAAITIADNKKITAELGFKPQFSDMNTIIDSTWRSLQP